MPKKVYFHICTLGKSDLDNDLIPRLPPKVNCLVRLKRFVKKSILVSADDPRSYDYYNCHSEILELRRAQFFSGSWVIHPFSNFRFYYKIYMCLVFFCASILMPIYSSFPSFRRFRGTLYVDVTVRCLCLVDIFFTLSTGVKNFDQKTVSMSRKEILKSYFSSPWFFIDILSSLPICRSINVSRNAKTFVSFLGFLKIFRIKTFLEYIEIIIERMKATFNYFQILSLTLMTLLFYNYSICALAFVREIRIAIFGFTFPRGILHGIMVQNIFLNEYFHCLFYATSALLSIDLSFGEFAYEEHVCMIFLYLVGKIYFIYITVRILSMLWERNRLVVKYQSLLNEIEEFMDAKKITPVYQQKILQLYNYKFGGMYFKENKINTLFTERLNNEINYHVCKQLIKTVSIFNNIPKATIQEIIKHLKKEIYMPNDLIITAGYSGDSMYILASGTVSVITPSGKEVCHLQDGAHFGEICLLTPSKMRIAHVIAVEVSEIYVIDRVAFRRSFAKEPLLYKKLQEIAEERILETDKIEEEYNEKLMKMSIIPSSKSFYKSDSSPTMKY